ncbi:hypothetical protein O9929_06790 [Vibrio lentus]|nr:hypothetical protein [Vibrio lentus]
MNWAYRRQWQYPYFRYSRYKRLPKWYRFLVRCQSLRFSINSELSGKSGSAVSTLFLSRHC